jgi:hypothetical protein
VKLYKVGPYNFIQACIIENNMFRRNKIFFLKKGEALKGFAT